MQYKIISNMEENSKCEETKTQKGIHDKANVKLKIK